LKLKGETMFLLLLNLALTAVNIWWSIENFRYGHQFAGCVSLGAGAFCFSMAMLQINANAGF